MPDSLIETWRRIIIGEHKSWALFSNGACVILMRPEADLRRQAVELTKTYGPVHAGSPAGDLSVINSKRDPDAAELTIVHVEDNRGVITQ